MAKYETAFKLNVAKPPCKDLARTWRTKAFGINARTKVLQGEVLPSARLNLSE